MPLPKVPAQDDTQVMEVFAISDVCHVDFGEAFNNEFKDEIVDSNGRRKMQHCSAMTILKATNAQNPHQTAWVLHPRIMPYPYGYFRILVDDISQIFYLKRRNLVGFLYKEEEEKTNKCFIISLASATDPNNGTLDELEVFLKFCSKIKPDLEPVEIFNRSYIKKFLKEPPNNVFNAEMVFDNIIQKNAEDFSSDSMFKYFGQLMRPYLRPYVYFMLKNHHLDKKAIKKHISAVKNIPEFMKSFSWTKEVMLFEALCTFLARHSCQNPTCDGFSLTRCGGCDHASYCNVDCQEEGAKDHDCEISKKHRRARDFLPELIEKDLKMFLVKEPSISLHSFSKSLLTRIYRSFHGALQNKYFLSRVQARLSYRVTGPLLEPHRDQRRSGVKMLSLVKAGRDTQSLYTVRTQLEEAYGPDNEVIKMMKKC